MGSKRSVDPAAFNTKDNSKVDGDPFGFGLRAAVRAPAISLVSVSYNLKQLHWVIFEVVAFGTSVRRARSNSSSPVHVGVGRVGRSVMVVLPRV